MFNSRGDEMQARYPYLSQLIDIYFSEDWFEDYDRNEHAAVRGFFADHGAETAASTLDELRRMTRGLSTAEFEEDFGELMWAYSPQGGATPYREFADRIAGWLAESLERDADVD